MKNSWNNRHYSPEIINEKNEGNSIQIVWRIHEKIYFENFCRFCKMDLKKKLEEYVSERNSGEIVQIFLVQFLKEFFGEIPRRNAKEIYQVTTSIIGVILKGIPKRISGKIPNTIARDITIKSLKDELPKHLDKNLW